MSRHYNWAHGTAAFPRAVKCNGTVYRFVTECQTGPDGWLMYYVGPISCEMVCDHQVGQVFGDVKVIPR